MNGLFALTLLCTVLLLGCTAPAGQAGLTSTLSVGSPTPQPPYSNLETPTATPVTSPDTNGSAAPTAATQGKLAVGEKFDISFGRTVQIEELTLIFSNVTEDSRCPSDVQCVWAGRVVVEFTVKIGNAGGTIKMTPNPRYPQKTGFGGYRIVLFEVYPYPSVETPIQIGEYTVTVAVEKT